MDSYGAYPPNFNPNTNSNYNEPIQRAPSQGSAQAPHPPHAPHAGKKLFH